MGSGKIQYPDKKGANSSAMMLNIVFKVARALAPSVSPPDRINAAASGMSNVMKVGTARNENQHAYGMRVSTECESARAWNESQHASGMRVSTE
mmetsp:Transcript_36150/g.95061  ORF Transcript_36150/g.95061 Transcript_36150/m.95061 type:complete len:94 (+) Transcript_36150:467-748(+)